MGALGGVGREGGALVNGISALINETPQKSPLPLPPREDAGRSQLSATCKRFSPDAGSAGATTSGLLASRTVKGKCPLFTSHAVCVLLPRQPERTTSLQACLAVYSFQCGGLFGSRGHSDLRLFSKRKKNLRKPRACPVAWR